MKFARRRRTMYKTVISHPVTLDGGDDSAALLPIMTLYLYILLPSRSQ